MIRINDTYVILGHDSDYSLCIDTKKKNKKDEDVYKNLGYYSTVQGCVKALIRYKSLELAREEKLTMLEYIKRIEEISNKLLKDIGMDDK